MRIDPAGWPFITGPLAPAALAAAVGRRWVAWPFLALSAYMTLFFRDPDRACDATPPPPAPSAPAALRRDAASHLEITDRRVKRFLDERFGGFEHDPAWGYHGGFGSARVFVDVVPVLESSTAVRASSPVLSDIDLSDELAIELLRLSAQRPFGGYSYVPSRREVWFEHAILGDDLDRLELEAAIEVVAEAADGDDDLLAGRFGGARYADLGR